MVIKDIAQWREEVKKEIQERGWKPSRNSTMRVIRLIQDHTGGSERLGALRKFMIGSATKPVKR